MGGVLAAFQDKENSMTSFRLLGLNVPNQLTVFRIVCAPLFVASVLYLKAGREYLYMVPFLIFLIAALTDALDGLIARLFKQQTTLGVWLDPIADKILLVSAFWVLAYTRLPDMFLPIWLVVTVISRDVILGLGVVLCQLMELKLVIRPNVLGKITTFLQMTTIGLCVLRVDFFKDGIWAITAGFTVISGMFYIQEGLARNYE